MVGQAGSLPVRIKFRASGPTTSDREGTIK
jgi:hypothetical protein